MKLPSITHLAHLSSKTFVRFPFVIINAILGSVLAIVLVELSYESAARFRFLNNVLMSTALGIPLFTTIVLYAEKKKWHATLKLVTQLIGAFLLAAYSVSLPFDVSSSPSHHLIRFALFVVGLHFLIAFAPFAGKNEINGFWQYNRSLFLRFLTAVLYSAVLYAGLAIALAAVNHLFSIDIKFERYYQLWLMIIGIFNTWFFLAGVPENLDALNTETEYPKGLKIFTQYILIPLVLVYLLILYAYAVKIIINWDWPKGWVANLILGFSITGILSLLLVYPVQDRVENVWIRTFSRRYYLALVPLVFMLLLAVWRRISDYGVTENRYFVSVLGIWLAGVVAYFLLSRAGNIKVIPATLCAIALLSSFGPWGAFSISEQSQVTRLKDLLTKHGILVDGKVRKVQAEVGFGDIKEICSIVRYMVNVHGSEGIQPLFSENLESLGKEKGGTAGGDGRYGRPGLIVGLMGLSYIDEWQTKQSTYYQFAAKRQDLINIEGYDFLLRSQVFSSGQSSSIFSIEGEKYTIAFDRNTSKLIISRGDDATASIALELSPMLDSLIQVYARSNVFYNIPPEKMSVAQSGPKLKSKICVLNIQSEKMKDSIKSNYVEADVLIGRTSR